MIQSLLLLAFLVGVIHAFAPQHLPTTSSVSQSQSQLHLFFGNNNKQQPSNGASNKTNKVADEKKKPFIFLYGKPRYDWAKNRPLTLDEMRKSPQFDWTKASERRKSK